MKEVEYKITRFTKSDSYKFTGIGEIDDENLYTSFTNKYGELEKYTYEDCIRYLHPVIGKKDQYFGAYDEIQTIEFENDRGDIAERKIQISYEIWINILGEKKSQMNGHYAKQRI